MNVFTGIAIDFKHGKKYTYPKSEEEIEKVRFPVDLIITKKGVWYYMFSSAKKETILQDDTAQLIMNKGEAYKIIDSITGEIFKESGA